MRALFLTQGVGLGMFHELARALRGPLELAQAGFYVSDKRHFEGYSAARPEILDAPLAKEWEIVARARAGQPDAARLAELERRLGDPSLWSALVADRRVFYGPHATLRQDYKPRFDRRTMLRILEEGARELERLFDAVRPDFVASFICVTFGEYLGWRLAATRGIPFLNLRPTRIANYVTYGESVHEPSAWVRARYESEGALPAEAVREARACIEATRAGHARYEGVIPPSRTPARGTVRWRRAPARLLQMLRDAWLGHAGGEPDHHAPSRLAGALEVHVRRRWRAAGLQRSFQGRYVKAGQLAGLEYAFFPLHTEPEVTLLVYSRHCLNQIEVVRNAALALPVGMTLVVKEHPASVGKRPLGYYEKLIEIPNVLLADPALDSRALVEQARLVVTIAGSVGLEALLRRKPVLTFGATPYGFLPDCMTRRSDPASAPSQVRALLDGYRCDEAALERFVAATIAESAPVNLYSALLGKLGVFRPDSARAGDWDHEIAGLAEYTVRAVRRAGL